ncbi:hypothetical protein MTZ49_15365 [Entomomonas sp. E2T0]|uniref:hypothetical protein n=1 Tax=Entomomonas sp. E2T0 TaxID=2930213 RepID=UPI0022284D22|nr:hypothetical protein [Entomomonas sp. E2T0]UYZ83949.1 hypothetical protein MTZ49_15365 [Entomomonas sp. E2T0]
MAGGNENKNSKDNKEISSGKTERKPKTTQEVEISNKTQVVVFYIGGAADKRAWYGPAYIPILRKVEWKEIGPYHNIRYVKEKFEASLEANKLDKSRYEGIYLGYYEVYKEKQQNSLVEKYLACKDKKHLKIVIIGHSLGGWNGAHFCNYLVNKKKYTVDFLITIDPVGVGDGVKIVADVINSFPTKIKVRKSWHNILEIGSSFGNAVAKVGERWIPGYGWSLSFQSYEPMGSPVIKHGRDDSQSFPDFSYISEYAHDYAWHGIYDKEKLKIIAPQCNAKEDQYTVIEETPIKLSPYDHVSIALREWLKK